MDENKYYSGPYFHVLVSPVLWWESVLDEDLKLWSESICSGSTFSVKSDLGPRLLKQAAFDSDLQQIVTNFALTGKQKKEKKKRRFLLVTASVFYQH